MRVSATVFSRDVNSFEILWNYVTAAWIQILDSIGLVVWALLVVACIAYYSEWQSRRLLEISKKLDWAICSKPTEFSQVPTQCQIRSHVEQRAMEEELENQQKFFLTRIPSPFNINSHHRRLMMIFCCDLRILHIVSLLLLISSYDRCWLLTQLCRSNTPKPAPHNGVQNWSSDELRRGEDTNWHGKWRRFC